MPEVKRKKGESFESLLRRFSRSVQQSGQLLQARKIRFFTRPLSKNASRSSALRRMQITDKRAYLERIGQLPEETRKGKRRR